MPPTPIPHGQAGPFTTPRQLNGRWQISCRFRKISGDLVRVTRSGSTKTAARDALKTAITEMARAKESTAALTASDTFNTAADMWMRRVERKNRGTTVETYRRVLGGHVRPAVGQLKLREVNVPRLQAVFDDLEDKGLAPSTRRTVRTVFRGVLKLAVRDGAIPANPVSDIDEIRSDVSKPAPRALTPVERDDLLAKLDADPAAVTAEIPDIVRFMLGTGVRIGEALAARWGDLDLVEVHRPDGQTYPAAVIHIAGNIVRVTGAGLVRHEGKTATSKRTVPLPQFVVEMLTRRRPVDAPDDRPIFPSAILGYRDARNTARSLRETRQRAGYEWVHAHVFRKTAATEWQRGGLEIRAVADLMGHANISMTQDTYTGRKQLHELAAAAMDRAWTGQKEAQPASEEARTTSTGWA